jgi:hypothetical protein
VSAVQSHLNPAHNCRLDDLLARREKTERVTDLVNLDRVRGLLRTIYWRRRFLVSREERRRTLNAEARGIPAIVLEPTPLTPPMDADEEYPFAEIDISRSPSPPGSRQSSPSPSPEMRSLYLHRSRSPDLRGETLSAGCTGGAGRHSPSLSVNTERFVGRRSSGASLLSEDEAHSRS